MKRFGVVAMVAGVCLGVSVLSGCSGDTSDIQDLASEDVTLTFEVSGTAKEASITYVTDGLGIQQDNSAKVPWSKTVKFTEGITGVNMSAQNAGGGEITCRILKGDEVLSENTSKGDYAIASCAV